MMGPALRVGLDKLRFVTQDIGGGFGNKITSHPQLVALLPARAQARPARPVDGVAHRLHTSQRRTATSAGSTTSRSPSRPTARCSASAPRRSTTPARSPLRAARRRHLGAGHARLLPLAEHPRRLHAGDDEQGAGLAEPRLLADAAPLVHRADHRHRRPRARPRPGRGAQAQLRPRRGDAVRDAERLRLRLRRLRALPRHRARADRLRPDRGARADAESRGKLLGVGIGSTLDSGTNNFGQSRLINPELQFSGQQRGGDGQARHLRRGRRHARHDAAGPGPRDDRGAGGRRHHRLHARRRERPARARLATGTRTPASPGRTRASSPSPGSARSRARPSCSPTR